jgi:hypothetical protein
MEEKDWLIINEALCFASQRETEFKEFLIERNKKDWKKLIKRFDRDKTDSGHKLIGLVNQIIFYPKYQTHSYEK